MKEIIMQKLEELDKQREQIMANYNAVCGAQQVLRELMAKADEETTEDEPA